MHTIMKTIMKFIKGAAGLVQSTPLFKDELGG
jgi:hypothetical protein